MVWILVICTIVMLVFYTVNRNKNTEVESKELNTIDAAKEKMIREKMIEKERALGNIVIAAQRRYHREDCKFVNKANQLITIDQAKERGLKPCKRCKPC